jgi:hypothetical protein
VPTQKDDYDRPSKVGLILMNVLVMIKDVCAFGGVH